MDKENENAVAVVNENEPKGSPAGPAGAKLSDAPETAPTEENEKAGEPYGESAGTKESGALIVAEENTSDAQAREPSVMTGIAPLASMTPTVTENASSVPDVQTESDKKSPSFSVLTALLCAASVLAFVCAGIFAADAISRTGDVLLYSGIAAAPEESGAAPAMISAVDTASDKETTPDEDGTGAQTESEKSAGTSDASLSETFPVVRVSMSADEPFALSNMTGYDPDVGSLTGVEAFASSLRSSLSGPSVLVVHTHATEAYLKEGQNEYDDQTSFRSEDPSENVVAVGDEICAVLEKNGIKTLHCKTLFDTESFEQAYDKSAAAVVDYLSEYPGLHLVLDVHRDAIFRPDKTLLAPVCSDGAAQVMLVCGTDELGAIFPDWTDNLSFAFSVQTAARALYPDLMRGVNLRGPSFNEQLAERYLLVEVGSAGNTLDEAKEGARRFAEALAAVIDTDRSEVNDPIA